VERRLTALIARDAPLAVTEPVVMEVLAGARTDRRESELRRLLLRFHLLHFDAIADFDGATRIYRRCRNAGITPRGMIDCMIGAVAWRRGAAVLACDADFARVAQVIGIELDERPRIRRLSADLIERGLTWAVVDAVASARAVTLVVRAKPARAHSRECLPAGPLAAST
jgi:predicted nucleic acid-binding protein